MRTTIQNNLAANRKESGLNSHRFCPACHEVMVSAYAHQGACSVCGASLCYKCWASGKRDCSYHHAAVSVPTTRKVSTQAAVSWPSHGSAPIGEQPKQHRAEPHTKLNAFLQMLRRGADDQGHRWSEKKVKENTATSNEHCRDFVVRLADFDRAWWRPRRKTRVRVVTPQAGNSWRTGHDTSIPGAVQLQELVADHSAEADVVIAYSPMGWEPTCAVPRGFVLASDDRGAAQVRMNLRDKALEALCFDLFEIDESARLVARLSQKAGEDRGAFPVAASEVAGQERVSPRQVLRAFRDLAQKRSFVLCRDYDNQDWLLDIR